MFDPKTFGKYKKYMHKLGVLTGHRDLTDQGMVTNGLVIAFLRVDENSEGRMLEVSVSYCSPDDEFDEEIGLFHALDKMFDKGESIQIPLGDYLKKHGPTATTIRLLDMLAI